MIHEDDDIVEMKKPFDRERLLEGLARAVLDSKRPWDDWDDSLKPVGFWYAKGDSWLKWCLEEKFGRVEKSYIYRVKINKKNVLRVSDEKGIRDLVRRFPLKKCPMRNSVDWRAIAQEYEGIEFNPYVYEMRFSGHTWYYTLDVPSGCIWSPWAIEEVVLIRTPLKRTAAAADVEVETECEDDGYENPWGR